MAEPTLATKLPLRPTCRYNHGELPPLESYEKVLEEHKRLYARAGTIHKVIEASTPDAMAKGHSKGLGDHSHASPSGSLCTSNAGSECAVQQTFSGRRLVTARRRRVAARKTSRVCNASTFNLKLRELDEPLLSKSTMKTRGSKKVVPGNATMKGRNQKKRRTEMSTDDVSIKARSSRSNTLRLEVKKPMTATSAPVCHENAEPQVPTAVDLKGSTSMLIDDAGTKAQLVKAKSLRLEPQECGASGPTYAYEEDAEPQGP
ncbi:hypothetical protein HPB50_002718 [Hyalomma asiaticum]|uniref:Uncharacterized protein n=1 Tax=Hyalomma asiaticum TaxID=266040 RepID=A0ACB7TBF1_HYAAI|nr:hypothetical protein HPB50_002718 [Hyalomma asiaticum]